MTLTTVEIYIVKAWWLFFLSYFQFLFFFFFLSFFLDLRYGLEKKHSYIMHLLQYMSTAQPWQTVQKNEVRSETSVNLCVWNSVLLEYVLHYLKSLLLNYSWSTFCSHASAYNASEIDTISVWNLECWFIHYVIVLFDSTRKHKWNHLNKLFVYWNDINFTL